MNIIPLILTRNHTSFEVSNESNNETIFLCFNLLIMSISLCRLFNSFSSLFAFGMNFIATIYEEKFSHNE